MADRVGWIGLGIMGTRQAANLRRAGYELTVYNRTRETAQAWAQEHGATVAATPAEVAQRSDIVFSMVVDGAQVEHVLLGEHGVVEGGREGLLIVDMSTIGPADARHVGERLDEHGVHFLDAPVTGSAPRAADGTLTIMVGGETEDFERAKPLLEAMGELIVYAGPRGHGQAIKVVNNAVAAANTNTLGQALLVGDAMGVDLDALVKVMAAGAGGSVVLDLKAAPMREHDYTTLFKLEHMLKDVRLCLEEGQAAGVPFPAAAEVREVLNAALGRGLGDADFAALMDVLEGLAGRRL